MTVWGVLIGLIIAIVLIIRKVSPVYSLILGSLIGGLIGGFPLSDTVSIMIDGVKDVTPAILRILSAGVLSGVLVKTGAAVSISNTIIHKLGQRHVFMALALATMLLTTIGVFIDVAVITVAPIALSLGQKLSIPKSTLLLVMIGGGKSGNIISPNPNTIIAAENFRADLSSVMFANLLPAVIGLLFTVYIVVRFLPSKGELSTEINTESEQKDLPSFATSMVAPIVAISLLSFRPLFGFIIDPLIALPIGGLSGILVMRKWRTLKESLSYGLDKMSIVAILLIGTGTLAGDHQSIFDQGSFIRCIIACAIWGYLYRSAIRCFNVGSNRFYNSRSYSCFRFFFRNDIGCWYQFCMGGRNDQRRGYST